MTVCTSILNCTSTSMYIMVIVALWPVARASAVKMPLIF